MRRAFVLLCLGLVCVGAFLSAGTASAKTTKPKKPKDACDAITGAQVENLAPPGTVTALTVDTSSGICVMTNPGLRIEMTFANPKTAMPDGLQGLQHLNLEAAGNGDLSGLAVPPLVV